MLLLFSYKVSERNRRGDLSLRRRGNGEVLPFYAKKKSPLHFILSLTDLKLVHFDTHQNKGASAM